MTTIQELRALLAGETLVASAVFAVVATDAEPQPEPKRGAVRWAAELSLSRPPVGWATSVARCL